MKKNFLCMITVMFLVLIFGSWSWAQCPEDTVDRGECDTLNVICLDTIQSPGGGPYFVRFPLLITHDVLEEPLDLVAGIVIPLTWTHTNPAAYCSVSDYWNTDSLPPDNMVHSIFRDVDGMTNWMASVGKWEVIQLELDGTSNFWLSCIPFIRPMMGEVDRALIATITFKIEDTMHVCIDTTFWPPVEHLKFSRSDGQTYVPRDNLPLDGRCFYIGPPSLEIISPNGGETWAVGTTQDITWLSKNFDENVTIEYRTHPSSGWSPVATNIANTGSYPWPIPDTPSDSCEVRIWDAADGSPIDYSDSLFSIVKPDFTIEVEPETLEVVAGDTVDCDVILESLYGFAEQCTLSLSGLPAGASGSFDPNPVVPTDTSLLTIGTLASTDPDTYDVIVTAAEMDKGIEHTADLVLIVTPPPDFTIEVDPETLEIIQGDEDSCDVILTSFYGFDSPCTLTVSDLPQDASGEFDPATLVPTPTGDTSVLTISVAETTPTGTCTLTITATEMVPPKGQVEHSMDVILIVRSPDFSIEVDPETLEIIQGDEDSCDVILTSLYGFDSPCTLTVSDLPQDASGEFDPLTLVPTPTGDTSVLTISVAETTPIGTCTLTVTATELLPPKGQVEHSVEVVLVVRSPQDFTIDVYPDTLRIPRGTDSSYTVKLTSIDEFNSPCTLTVSDLPQDASGEFDPPTLVPTLAGTTSVLTISVAETTPVGTCTLTVTATEMVWGKQIEHSQDVTLIVAPTPWAFYVEAEPDTKKVEAGDSTNYEVFIVPNMGFAAPCTLSISGLPSVDSFSFDPEVILPNDTSVLTIFTAVSTPVGICTLTIKATANPRQDTTTTVILIVDEQSDVEDWTDNPNTPKSFALFQNQPNPFNPETKISYYLPKACQVRLTIYNVLGQRVKTLFDGYQDAGMQTLLWDGRGDGGVQLSSGIYFYRLQADNFHQTKKMTLVK